MQRFPLLTLALLTSQRRTIFRSSSCDLEMNSDDQTHWQAPLPADPFHLPQSILFKWIPWTRITRESPASLRPLSFMRMYKEALQSIWRTKPKLRENCPRDLVLTWCGCASCCGRTHILAPSERWAPFRDSDGPPPTTQHDHGLSDDIYPAFPMKEKFPQLPMRDPIDWLPRSQATGLSVTNGHLLP